MILIRSQNTQQHPAYCCPSSSNHHMAINQQQPQQICIYPCCYQIHPRIYTKGTQHLSENHVCILAEDPSIPCEPLNIKLDPNSSLGKSFNSVKTHTSCSVCQKSTKSGRNLAFYNCLQCKRQFCQKCSTSVHSKGKFLSHRILKLKSVSQTEYNYFTCQTHLKPRKHLLKGKIVCEICFKEESGKLPSPQKQVIDPTLLKENIKFSLQYINQIYHNQANKITDIKQNLNSIYKECIQKIQHKYNSSLAQIAKLQSNIKYNFTKTITQLTQITSQVQTISINSQSFLNLVSQEVINTRIHLIQQKVFEIQSQCEQFISQISYDYKIGDKDKNQQLIEQFLKFLTLIKTKRQQEDAIDTNRSSFRHNIKTSRTTSRLSSNRLTNSKDNRCQSSFNKHENMSSSKNNSSLKQKDRNSLVKNYINQDMNRKNTDMTKSIIVTNRNSIGKSISKKTSLQPSAVSSRNNSALFNQKDKNYDVKELQKAEYQDLNLNLKKIMGTKKTNDPQNFNLLSQNGSKLQSESTSLQKDNKNNKENQMKRNILIRENEKPIVNSGSFLKVFDQKNRSGGRKNYLVSSGEELPDFQQRPKVNEGQQSAKASPQNLQQIKKKKIKDQFFGSNRGSSGNKFSEVQTYDKYKDQSASIVKLIQSKQDQNSKNSNNSRQSQQLQNRSCIFDNLVALSEERRGLNTISDFNFKSGEDHVLGDLTKSIVSQFSYTLPGQTSQSHIDENLKDIQITQSIKLQDQTTGTIKLQDQTRKSNKSPRTNKSIIKPQVSKSVFKDSTNTLKGVQKMPQQKVTTLINDKAKKKPDFMDMRQKMRKPNYLSTKLNNNLNGPNDPMKRSQYGKK